MGDKNKTLMSIIVLNWNRLEYTKKTISRILETTTMPNQLILVDNNSTEESGVRQYLDTVKGNAHTVEVIRVYNSINYGVAGGRNTGLMRAKGDYLVTIDDDILVPNKWDVLMAEACDKIPKLGITGVNVEPIKFPVKEINGVKVRPKNGNLGGACLCLPRRIFKRVGYYNYNSKDGGNLYGHEDSLMYYRLNYLGLISAYIAPRGVHLDTDQDKAYRVAKNEAHKKGSIQLRCMSGYLKAMRKTGDVYVSFDPKYEPPDKDIFTNELITGDKSGKTKNNT